MPKVHHKVCPQVKHTIASLTLEQARQLAIRLNALYRQGIRFNEEQLDTLELLRSHLEHLKRVEDVRNPHVGGAITLLLSSLTFDDPLDDPTHEQLDRMCKHFGINLTPKRIAVHK